MDSYRTLFTDADRVARRIQDDIAPQVAAVCGRPERPGEHTQYRAPGARPAVATVMQLLLKEDRQEFVENESFKGFVGHGPGDHECGVGRGPPIEGRVPTLEFVKNITSPRRQGRVTGLSCKCYCSGASSRMAGSGAAYRAAQ